MRSSVLLSPRGYSLAILALGTILTANSRAHAGLEGEGKHKEIIAKRASRAPKIDGRIDDVIWQRIPPDDRFRQVFPTSGDPASMRTTVRVAFDKDNLYFAIEAFDPDPSKISTQLARRDSRNDSDYIELFLDTRHDHDSGFWFRINAAGVLADGELHDDFRVNYDWDAVWTGETHIGAHGWSAEIAIPLSVLRFSSSASPEFGFDLKRGIRRLGEIDQWIYKPRTASGTLSRAGHIHGLASLEPRRVIELRPFAVVQLGSQLSDGSSALLGAGDNTPKMSAGIDAKIGVTEGITLDATINPDFGQVEADPVVLNLSSFETFFPEKRPFFLEGSGLFETDIRLINTRRIGERTSGLSAGSTYIDSSGNSHIVRSAPLAVPTYAALRLSGRATSRISLNTLSAITGPERLVIEVGDSQTEVTTAPARNYSAMRAKYSLGGSSYLGMVATGVTLLGDDQNAAHNHDSYAGSFDGRWVRSDGKYRAYFQIAASHRAGGGRYQGGDTGCSPGSPCRKFTRIDGTIVGPGDTGSAGEIGAAKAAGAFRVYSRYRWISPRFDVDALGFENNWDYHDVLSRVSYQHEHRFLGFERAEAALSARSKFAFEGTRKTLNIRADVSALTRKFWHGNLKFLYQPLGTFTSRESLDGAFFENSDVLMTGIDLETDSRKDLSLGIGAQYRRSPTTEMRGRSAYAFAALRPSGPLEVKLQANLARKTGDLRVVQCTSEDGSCWRQSKVRSYQMALQDSHSLNVTARLNWALSTELSFEGYAQVFAAGGEYNHYSALEGALGPRPKLRRNATTPIDTPSGGARSFSFATLNVNLVARWEMTPGTALIAVYTRAQRHGRDTNRLAFSGLRGGRAEEVFLLKYAYFYRP